MNDPAVHLEGVRIVRQGRTILDGVDLSVGAGEVRFLVGASGCGKTTALRVVAGLETPDEGTVTLGGRAVSRAGRLVVPPHARGVALAFQDGALWEHLTVEQHLRFGLDAHVPSADERRARIEDVLELVGLASRRRDRPGPLSGGERQRVSLARALVHRARVLLLDEPLAHVDLASQADLARRVAAWVRRDGSAVLWVTHRPQEVAFVGGSVSVLAGGRIVEEIGPAAAGDWARTVDA